MDFARLSGEAALSNTMCPGDHVLMFETGHFASLWAKTATRLHLRAEVIVGRGEDLVESLNII